MEAAAALDNFDGEEVDFVKALLKKKSKTGSCSEEVNEFAYTLHFHYSRAYEFLRKTFALPSPSSLRTWLSSFLLSPWFFKQEKYLNGVEMVVPRAGPVEAEAVGEIRFNCRRSNFGSTSDLLPPFVRVVGEERKHVPSLCSILPICLWIKYSGSMRCCSSRPNEQCGH
ncbi:THAP9 [Lepeophtheirus salmonis]|uniref:THAP9 n=1 Tax=Lepeophtheirus salmonis TaxID=72036 RepID=A0A7R8CG96_LEPSM|nr:THAP9 [Lepeophtheirus salmonis]CAF2767073.1 THAP9 [Lepeophtheirus salmonis]